MTAPDPFRLDGGELTCARLLVLLQKKAVELGPGAVIHLSTTDPVAVIDVPAWCHLTGNDYLGRVSDGPPAVYAVVIA